MARYRELNKRKFDILYPGFSSHQQSQIFCLWPNERWSRCGYSSPGVGQLCMMLPRLKAGWQDKLSFAGEYRSTGFYGYIEGGLHSGAVLAGRLARRFSLVHTG